MEKILQQLQEPTWWFSTILVGLLLSIAGTFLSRYIEGVFSKYMKNQAAKKQEADEAKEIIARALAENPDLFLVFLHFSQRILAFAFATGLLTIILLLFATTINGSPILKFTIIFLGLGAAVATAALWSILNDRIPMEIGAHRIYVKKLLNYIKRNNDHSE